MNKQLGDRRDIRGIVAQIEHSLDGGTMGSGKVQMDRCVLEAVVRTMRDISSDVAHLYEAYGLASDRADSYKRELDRADAAIAPTENPQAVVPHEEASERLLYEGRGEGLAVFTLAQEIRGNTPIDYEGGEHGGEPRWLVTEAQMDYLDRIEAVAIAATLKKPDEPAGQQKHPFTVVGFYPATQEFPIHHVQAKDGYEASAQAELDTAGDMTAVAVFAGHLDELSGMIGPRI